MLGDLAVGGEWRREHDPDVVLLHDVAGPVADAGLEPGERDRREAPQGAEVRRRLARVADPELDVVDAVEREEVLRLGERVLVEMGARLVGGRRARHARAGGLGRGVGHGKLPLRRLPGGGDGLRPGWTIATTLARPVDGGQARPDVPDWPHERSAPVHRRPLVPPRGLPRGLRGAPPEGRRGRAMAARRGLRHRPRGVLGPARGPVPRRRDAHLLARRVRAARRGGTWTGRWSAVRAPRHRHAARGRARARPDAAAARAVRPDRQLDRALGATDVGGATDPATARRSASTRASAR